MMSQPKEILPGVFHWTTPHPRIRIPVSSYYLSSPRVLIDPLVPSEGGLDWFRAHGGVAHIYLANRHHYRQAGRFREEFGATIACNRLGLHEFKHGEQVDGFDTDTDLPGGVRALPVGALCPDESALYVADAEAIAFADGLVRDGDGPLSFVPDKFMGDDPEAVKRGLRASYRRLLDLRFDHLLLAHGHPFVRGGRDALRRWLEPGSP